MLLFTFLFFLFLDLFLLNGTFHPLRFCPSVTTAPASSKGPPPLMISTTYPIFGSPKDPKTDLTPIVSSAWTPFTMSNGVESSLHAPRVSLQVCQHVAPQEFMSGGSLYEFLHKQRGVFKLPSLLKVAIDVSKGMNYLHQNDIIHKDLKTANLLMDENEVFHVTKEARAKGFFDILFLDAVEHKYVEEVSSCNAFMVKVVNILLLWE
ncbi:hypothetical protein JHK87_031003 [Glycine soja]|nr:hypothetical protein JHK87_031003 [Glycine soja]